MFHINELQLQSTKAAIYIRPEKDAATKIIKTLINFFIPNLFTPTIKIIIILTKLLRDLK